VSDLRLEKTHRHS